MRLSRRDLLASSLAVAALAPRRAVLAQEPAVDPELPWYRRLLVGVEWGPTGGNADPLYLSRASGPAIVDACLRAKAEYLVLFCKDMAFAYYPSKVAATCPGLGGRDLLAECLAAAEPHGLPVVAYCQCQYDTATWNAHPEWRMKDHQGNDLGGRLCYRSGYLEHVQACATEMLAYPIVGFHFDMLDFGFGPPYGCWCPTCRRDFEALAGRPMPDGVTWDEDWRRMLEFRCDSNAGFCAALREHVKAIRPEVAVDYNYHGYPPFSWETGQRPVQHALMGDFVTAEGCPWRFGNLNVPLLAQFLHGARADGAVQIASSRSVYDYHDYTIRPAADLRWEVLTYASHNVQTTIVDKANYDGYTDPVAYDRLAPAFGEVRAKREYFGHRPQQTVGIWYSHRTRDWFGRDDPSRAMRAPWGLHRALLQAHRTLGYVMDESADLERLRSFELIWLPGVAVLSEDDLELLEAYVAGGGKLVITGVSGALDTHGRPSDAARLGALGGWKLVRPILDRHDNYLRLPGNLADTPLAGLLRDLPADWLMLCNGPAAVLEPAGAAAYGELCPSVQAPPNPWSGRLSAGPAAGPAVLRHQVGAGQVITVAAALDEAFASNYKMAEHRHLIRNLVDLLDPTPALRVDAPVNVETVITAPSDTERLVHLLAFWAPATSSDVNFPRGDRVLPALMEEAHRYTATIHLAGPPARATAWGGETAVRVEGDTIRVETGEVHEVVRVAMG